MKWILLLVWQFYMPSLNAQNWDECNDFIGKWKFGASSVLEIKKDPKANEQPEFNFEESHYKDWKFSASEFKKSEWHFVFQRDPKAEEINNEIPAEIRKEISDPNSANKNTWFLEIVLKHDEGTTLHTFDACANTLKMTWYKGIINWDKTTKKLDRVFNYPMTEAKLSPYTNPDKQKITTHIEEYTATRKPYEIPDWNSIVFDWKNDDLTICGTQAKRKINDYIMSKGVTHTFTEFFKTLKPVTKNPIGDGVWKTIADKLGDIVKGLIKDKALEYVKNKFNRWCNGEYDICRYDIKETHVFYEPQSYIENLLLGSGIAMVFLTDKYTGQGHCLIILDNSKVKNEKDCRENLFISADFSEILPEKAIEGGGMKKWHLKGEIDDVSVNITPANDSKSPCEPTYERVQRVKAAVNNAKNKAKAQQQAMNNSLQQMNAAEKGHFDYLKAQTGIEDKQKEIKSINSQIAALNGGFPHKRNILKAKITDLEKDITTLKTSLTGLAAGEADYQDKRAKYLAAREAWKEVMCQWLRNAISSGKWDQQDIDYLRNCYYDDELKNDIPKCD